MQVYVRDEEARLERPPKELKGFARIELRPGETRRVELRLGMRAFAYFDPQRAAWTAEAGRFEVQLGSSSRAIHLRAPVRLTADWAQPVGAAEQMFAVPSR